MNSTDPVSLTQDSISKINHTTYYSFSYTLVVDPSKISSDSEIVAYSPVTNTVTSISFCVSVDRYLPGATESDNIAVSNLKTNVGLTFDVVSTFNITSTITSSSIVELDEELELDTEVEVCQCDLTSVDCVDSPLSLELVDTLHICFTPESEDVVLSNLALTLTNEENGYPFPAVQFGDDGFTLFPSFVESSDDFRVGSTIKTTKISVLMFYEFFEDDNTLVRLTGTSILEFDRSTAKKSNAIKSFELSFILARQDSENEDTTSTNCMTNLFQDVIDIINRITSCLLV